MLPPIDMTATGTNQHRWMFNLFPDLTCVLLIQDECQCAVNPWGPDFCNGVDLSMPGDGPYDPDEWY